jgi:hypothetical protein
MSTKTKSVLMRFFKGFVSGAITTMSLVVVFVPQNLVELKVILSALAFAGIAGGINGLLLAINKWASWTDEY